MRVHAACGSPVRAFSGNGIVLAGFAYLAYQGGEAAVQERSTDVPSEPVPPHAAARKAPPASPAELRWSPSGRAGMLGRAVAGGASNGAVARYLARTATAASRRGLARTI